MSRCFYLKLFGPFIWIVQSLPESGKHPPCAIGAVAS